MKSRNSVFLDSRQRIEQVGLIKASQYDLVVIGGGITGCGIALDAVARGLKVLLIEKKDYASGTSSKSTKLIHGGLRYLKQLEFGLVRETGNERAILHNLAPHLVHPEKMLLPIVNNGSFRKWSASLAISIYDWLAGVEEKDKKIGLTIEETLEKEPLLKQEMVNGGVVYSEFRTDDARLTIEVLKKAVQLGAHTINDCELLNFEYDNHKIKSANCLDHQSNQQIKIQAQAFINAAGPWVDGVRILDERSTDSRIHLTKGVHVVFSHSDLPIKQAIYFDDFTGRMIFAIPRGGATYVGTSDTEYYHNKDEIRCTKADASYLIDTVNNVFNLKLGLSDIQSSWAGLRPLIHEAGKSASEISRKDELFVSNSGLVSIAGGKLTGYRKMAERAVNQIFKVHPNLPNSESNTQKIQLGLDPFNNYDEVLEFYNTLSNLLGHSGCHDPNALAKYLTSNYGKSATEICSNALKDNNEPDLRKAILEQEIKYCIQFEGALALEDYVERRSGLLYFDIKIAEKYLDFIAECFARELKWPKEKTDGQKKSLMEKIEHSRTFD